MIVSEKPRPKHRANGETPSRHLYQPGITVPQFKAAYVIRLHGGSLSGIRTRRAAP